MRKWQFKQHRFAMQCVFFAIAGTLRARAMFVNKAITGKSRHDNGSNVMIRDPESWI
jgi:hypothetical protein